eukprot:5945654-Prymnesium_polylepis.1
MSSQNSFKTTCGERAFFTPWNVVCSEFSNRVHAARCPHACSTVLQVLCKYGRSQAPPPLCNEQKVHAARRRGPTPDHDLRHHSRDEPFSRNTRHRHPAHTLSTQYSAWHLRPASLSRLCRRSVVVRLPRRRVGRSRMRVDDVVGAHEAARVAHRLVLAGLAPPPTRAPGALALEHEHGGAAR